MDAVEKLLDSSERLYSHLTEAPEDSQRDVYIERMEALLESREKDLQELQVFPRGYLREHHLATLLIELDQGIQDCMEKVMVVIKKDIRDFQIKRKSNDSYSNPYAATRSIDGMYYDKKK
jgi:flagellar protein FliT